MPKGFPKHSPGSNSKLFSKYLIPLVVRGEMTSYFHFFWKFISFLSLSNSSEQRGYFFHSYKFQHSLTCPWCYLSFSGEVNRIPLCAISGMQVHMQIYWFILISKASVGVFSGCQFFWPFSPIQYIKFITQSSLNIYPNSFSLRTTFLCIQQAILFSLPRGPMQSPKVHISYLVASKWLYKGCSFKVDVY